LKGIGLDDKSLLTYIKSVGIQLPEGAKIEKIQPMAGFGNKEENNKPEEKDKAPKHKTGEDSTTREDQLTGRSKAFTDYELDQYKEEFLDKNAN